MKRITILTALLFICSGIRAHEAKHCTMQFQGYEREYFIHIPDSLDAGRPLVFMLHGHSGKAKGYYPEFMANSDKYGYAVCYPQGLVEPTPQKKTGWNVGYPFQEGWGVDDAAFLVALREKLLKEYKLNPNNVFFSGMSNGGDMCYLMANRYTDKFAAFAALDRKSVV